MEGNRLTWPQRGRLWLRLGIRGVLAAGAAAVTVRVVIPLISLLMPFVLALLLAWCLNPAVGYLHEKTTLSRRTVSLWVLLLVLLTAGAACYWVGRLVVLQTEELFANWEAVMDGAVSAVERAGELARRVGRMLPGRARGMGENLLGTATDWLEALDLSRPIKRLAGYAASLVSAIPGAAVAAVVFLTAGYLMTSDYPRMRRSITERLSAPTRRFLSQVKGVWVEALGGYLKSQLLLSFGVFLLLAAGFVLIGQPYGLLLALGLAVLDFIPLIGAGTVLVPWSVAELVTGRYAHAAELMTVWGVIVVFRRVAEPKVLGNQTGLSPVLSLLGIYVGMKAGGVPGMVLGPILLLVAVNLARLGLFRPAVRDIRSAAADVAALLREEHSE